MPVAWIKRATILLISLSIALAATVFGGAAQARADVPAPPDSPTVTAGDREADITFPVPFSDGGSPILKYEVSLDGGTNFQSFDYQSDGAQVTGTVRNLTNGTTYDFAVRAINADGASFASFSTSATPDVAPDPPTITSVKAGNGEATVAFTPAADNGGSSVQYFTATSAPGGFAGTCSASPCDVTGLTNGASYTFTVTATNTQTSTPSTASAAIVPNGPPLAPARLAVTSATSTTVAISASPAYPAGSVVTGYELAINGGTYRRVTYRLRSGRINVTATGLAPGRTYTFRLRARNANGAGTPSALLRGLTAPGTVAAPTARAGNALALVRWRPAAQAATTGYTVYARPGGATCTTYDRYDTACLIGAVTHVRTTFVVVARNSGGRSIASRPSRAVRATAVPVPKRLPAVPGGLSSGKTTKVKSGHHFTVTGSGFLPRSSVTLVAYRSKRVIVAYTVAGSGGSIRKSVRMPRGGKGHVTFVAFGVTPGGTSKAMSRTLTRTR